MLVGAWREGDFNQEQGINQEVALTSLDGKRRLSAPAWMSVLLLVKIAYASCTFYPANLEAAGLLFVRTLSGRVATLLSFFHHRHLENPLEEGPRTAE